MTYQDLVDSGAIGDRWNQWREKKQDERQEKRAEKIADLVNKTKEKVEIESRKRVWPWLLVGGVGLTLGIILARR